MAKRTQWYRDHVSGLYVFDSTVVVAAPVPACFAMWSRYENFPQFMTHVTRVICTGESTQHWEVQVAGRRAVWEALTTAYRPDEAIAWESTRGLRNSGSVRFVPDRLGCRIIVHLLYDPPYGLLGDFLAQHGMNARIYHDIQEDLGHFKEAVEAGVARREAA